MQLMKQWEKSNNITRQKKRNYNKMRRRRQNQGTLRRSTTSPSQTTNIDEDLQFIRNTGNRSTQDSSSLFRQFDYKRGVKRKLSYNNTTANRHHLTN
jgi:hypothetical protein